ncbi:MAG TPA: hypothetical protein P5511_05800, partial [Candidatus Goldiibacteriota bacterium]|nr:hypothetical protein [Candidatus Goldiibacteriota bacterium]
QTPNIRIEAFVNGVNSTLDYWIVVQVNSAYYKYATVTVNSDTLVFDGSNAYVASGATSPYQAGIDYTVTVNTEYGVFTAQTQGPGGSAGLTGDTVNYTYDGNSDFLLVRDNSSAITYSSLNDYSDIDPGFEIPSSAFPAAGNYSVGLYPYNSHSNAFTGPVTPSYSELAVEGFYTLFLTKP